MDSSCTFARVGRVRGPHGLRGKPRCAAQSARMGPPAAACVSCSGANSAKKASKRVVHANILPIGPQQAQLRGWPRKRGHLAGNAVAMDPEVSAAPLVTPPAHYRFRRQDGGWMNVRVDTLADGSCAVYVHATQLPPDVPCYLHWGMYRSSPSKWLHPKAAVPPGSEFRGELGGAMHTPLAPDARGGHSLTFAVPANLLPLYLGCSLYIGGPEPRFAGLKRGLHCTVPMGMGAGDASALGAHIIRDAGAEGRRGHGKFAVNFAVVSRNASAMSLRVMRIDDNRNVLRSMDVALDPVTNRSGDVWHISISNLSDAARVAYAWVATGPEGWDAATRFAPGKLLLDPYAETANKVKLEDTYGGGHAWVGSLAAQQVDFDWHGGARLRRAVENTFMMEVDVLSFTESGTAPPHRGKFLGVLDKLEVLKSMGVTAVVLSCPMLRGPGFGVGGQAHMSYFAPDPRFAVNQDPAAASRELKQLVHGLHAAGVEVLLEVEFCFTTEGGDTNAAVTGMRGIDAGLYYRPGGLLNLAHPVVRRLVVDSLCHWTSQYQVDGFMLLSAEALVQDQEGNVLDCPPLVQEIMSDPVLSGSKIVTYPIDNKLLPRDGVRGFPHAGRLLQHSNLFTKDVLEWLDTANPALISRVALRLTGSADMFDADEAGGFPGNLSAGRRPAMAINSTLSPIVDARSLQSWCQEVMDRVGPTLEAHSDWTILMRTVILVTVLAQGTPMLSTADVADTYMQRVVSNAMLVRRRLQEAMQPPRFDSPRDVAWYSVFGATPSWDEPGGEDDAFIALQVSTAATPGVYFGINPTRRPLTIMLPPAPKGTVWHVLVDTSSPCDDFVDVRPKAKVDAGNYILNPKAAFVLEAVPTAMPPRSPVTRAL